MSNKPTMAFAEVRNNDINGALRQLKKKMQREGVFRDMKEREFFTPNHIKRRDEQRKTKNRQLKKKIKELKREGLSEAQARRVAKGLKP